MTPSDLEFWLARLREEVASVEDASRKVVATFGLAEVEYVHGLHDAARATLTAALASFSVFHPGTWTSLVYRAAELCPRLGLNHLLQPELQRGREWADDPEVWNYNTVLPERVHDLALQLQRPEIAAEVLPDRDPLDADARAAVDRCVLAGWARDAEALRRDRARAIESVRETAVAYQLVRACTRCDLLQEAADIAASHRFPHVATPELLAALYQRSDDRAEYRRTRDGWFDRFKKDFVAEPRNHQFASADLRHCAEVTRRLGDRDGFAAAVAEMRRVVEWWKPTVDWVTCAVFCDLAVLYHRAGNADESRRWLAEAKRIQEGSRPDLTTARGSGSLIFAILSTALREVGNFDASLRHARKISSKSERQNAIVCTQVLAGMRGEPMKEIAKVDSAESRTSLIGFALRRALWSERDYPPGALPFAWFTKPSAGPSPC